MPAVLTPCLFYFVHLDENKLPITDTMFSKTTNNFDKNLGCQEGRVPPTQMSRVGQCFFKSHFRYFYKVNKTNGKILANSMWKQVGKPKNMCSGIYNILEYVIYDSVNDMN